jgi:MoaA/NifB/PqqE/SkfB family radical SAM enzyme
MTEKLETQPVSHRGWVWSFEDIDIRKLVDTVRRIQSRPWSFPFAFMPNLSYEDIPRYYKQHSDTFGVERCSCPWSVVQVLPNGDVATCIDLPDYIAGNIRHQSILDIWNNERYRKFRRVLREEGHMAACCRTSGLLGRGL